MTMNVRHIYYLIIAIVSLVITWSYGIQWMKEGGDVSNPLAMFIDAFNTGHPGAQFLTVDIFAAWMVFIVWVFSDCVKIGLGKKWGAFWIAVSYLGVCFTFPVYLIARERYLKSLENNSAK